MVACDISNEIGGPAIEQKTGDQFNFFHHAGFIMHPLPLDLVHSNAGKSIVDPCLKSKIDRYIKRSKARRDEWDWIAMGEYMADSLAIVSNSSGLPREIYETAVLPELEDFYESRKYPAQALIGCIDSFIEQSPGNAVEAFNTFFSRYKGEVAITLDPGKTSVRRILNERYLSSGTIGGSKNPCAPVVATNLQDAESVLREFERLLNQNPSEVELEKFLACNYRDVFGYKYDRIETQVWLRASELDIENKERKLDIFLRNCVEQDWELFELKKLTKLTKTYRDVPALAAEINASLQQVKNYRDLLRQQSVKDALKRNGIEYFEPSLHLIVGRCPDIPIRQWRWLKANFDSDIKLATYDEILKEMRARLSYVSHLYHPHETGPERS